MASVSLPLISGPRDKPVHHRRFDRPGPRGRQLAWFLAALHSDQTLRRFEAATGPVPAWYPLVTTTALRQRFGRLVTPGQQRAVGR